MIDLLEPARELASKCLGLSILLIIATVGLFILECWLKIRQTRGKS